MSELISTIGRVTTSADQSLFPPIEAVTTDLDFLQGSFTVVDRQSPSVPATAVAHLHFAGAVSVAELWFPDEQRYGLLLQLFEPDHGHWSTYWIDSRTGRLDGPLTSTWSDVTAASARWQHDGHVLEFTHTDPVPDHSGGPKIADDFDFLTGAWHVHHHRLTTPLDPAGEWIDADGRHHGRTYFNGAVSIDEISLDTGRRGLTVRTFDPAERTWSIYWVSSRDGRLQPPVHGRFEDGVGRFEGVDEVDGQPIRARFIWSDISPTTATWRQDFSIDDGATWQHNWQMQFTRSDA